MITTKTYDAALIKTAKKLTQLAEQSIVHAQDYVVTNEEVIETCGAMMELALRFKGQEEAR